MLTLNNLTPGERYEIQLWTNDCRIATSGKNYNPGKTTNIADLGGMVKLEQNSQKAAGGTGQYVTGMFIASGTSKTLTLAGSNPDDSADSREAILRVKGQNVCLARRVAGVRFGLFECRLSGCSRCR